MSPKKPENDEQNEITPASEEQELNTSEENASVEAVANEPVEKPVGPGERLRQVRESKSLSQEDVAEKLRLSKQQIIALESDDYTYVSAPIYAKGHLRLYSRLLGIPVAEVIKAFEQISPLVPEMVEIATNPAPSTAPSSSPSSLEKRREANLTRWTSFTLVTCLIILVAIWFRWHEHGWNFIKSLSHRSGKSVSAEQSVPLPIPPQSPDANAQSAQAAGAAQAAVPAQAAPATQPEKVPVGGDTGQE